MHQGVRKLYVSFCQGRAFLVHYKLYRSTAQQSQKSECGSCCHPSSQKAQSLYLPVAIRPAQAGFDCGRRRGASPAFFDSVSDPDRLADAMAGLTPQAWVTDLIANMEDLPADAEEWNHVRENLQGLDWLGCYELWHRLYARLHRGDVESDFIDSNNAALASWPKLELIPDVATLGYLTKQGHALDVPGVLAPGRLRVPSELPEHGQDLRHWLGYLIRLTSGARSRLRVTLTWHFAGSTRRPRRPLTSSTFEMRWCTQFSRTCTASPAGRLGRVQAWTGSFSGPAMSTARAAISAIPGTSSTPGSPRRGWTGTRPKTGRRSRKSLSSQA